MKIAVCDDDSSAREHIVSLINKQTDHAEILSFSSGEELLDADPDPDICFLDVEMKGLSGMETAGLMRQRQDERDGPSCIIIFITGYEKYMSDAFDVSAFHYLLKPLNEEKFRAVLGRALKELSAESERRKRYILIKNSGVQQKLYIKDIYYIESANKKVIIHTSDGTFECYGKMDEFEQMTGSARLAYVEKFGQLTKER